MIRNVCVFCGSSAGVDPRHRALATELGAALAANGLTLVWGGGRVGLMGALAEAVTAGGGRTVGVMPEVIKAREVTYTAATEMHEVGSMHERKATMVDLADAFVAMPGGPGTWDELCEVITWSQLGVHQKPIVLIDRTGYWDHFEAMFDHATAEGFVSAAHRALVRRARSVPELLALLGVTDAA
jgi:uncharacterized protein (TIGR00730 family)